ncbi:hypothetical protein LDENG_00168050 [Lucifuga dentata]|nr:hypothetical protein LDENG_00168050 [Lucifuga dentata]
MRARPRRQVHPLPRRRAPPTAQHGRPSPAQDMRNDSTPAPAPGTQRQPPPSPTGEEAGRAPQGTTRPTSPKVWVVGNTPSVPLMTALEEVLPVLFTLFCFTKKNVSHLRAPCQEIMLWFLSHAEMSGSLSVLKQLSGLQQPKNQVAADFCFTPGSSGGARLTLRGCSSNEDDALYEKLSGEQWRVECLMQLLAELKDNELPGDFFLELLWELTSLAAAAEEEEEDLKVSAMTLLEVEQQVLARDAGQSQKLALLQVLAVMCQSLPYTQLLRNTAQVVDFMVSLLQRACVSLDDATAQNPIESQTLSLGMGLVATLLSGPQFGAENYASLSRLLPYLEALSQKHPDAAIQELATNLRVVIATYGACHPVNLTVPAQCTRIPETRPKKSNLTFKKKQQMQTEQRDSQSSSHSSPPNTIVNAPTSTHIRHPELPEQATFGKGTTEGGQKSGSVDPCLSTMAFTDWLLEACDPDVPTRAFALRMLTQMVQDRNPEAVRSQEKVFTLFLENLEDKDSFIYLSAIQGLAVLADSYPERILERLLEVFQHSVSLSTSDSDRPLESRLKVGEVLMRASRAMGELLYIVITFVLLHSLTRFNTVNEATDGSHKAFP